MKIEQLGPFKNTDPFFATTYVCTYVVPTLEILFVFPIFHIFLEYIFQMFFRKYFSEIEL